MANVITRAGNNAPLTNDQLDGNFTALNSAKLETSAVGTTVLAYDDNLQTFVSAFTLPTTDGSAGQIVATDGSGVLSFVDNTSLPSQTGNAGKYLATDGSSAYWADVTGGSGGGGLANVAIDSQEYSATAGQTAFGVNYTDGYVLVYVNGVKLDPSEYTATSNTNITLSEGLALGDTVNLTGFSLTALSDVATSGAYGDLTGAPTAVSAFTNDSGYITGYSVSQADVTAHQAALSITKSQISDFGTYLTSETTTSLALSGNTLTYTDETGTATNIDLSAYLDEDSRAIASGTLNSATGVVTFTRDDATTFTLDLSALLDDTNLVTSVAGKSGVVTLNADDVSDSATKGIPTLTKQSNWDSAYNWGDHSAAGYLTSYTETSHSDVVVDGDFTSAGLMKTDGSGNYSVDTNTYLTSYTETDPVFTAWDKSTGISITESQISDFGTYLTSYTETDPVFTAWDKSTGISITESQISDLQSYLTTVALNDVSDVDTATSAPSDGQALLWDATNTKWVPGTVASEGGASTLIQLSDVYTSMSPTDGQVLTYDSTNGWQAEDAPTSSGGGGGLTYVTKTANYTASSGQGILADTSGGAFTLTLPASPSAGDQVVVADSGNSFATNRLTVARNASTIADAAEDLVLDINDVLVDLIYDGSTWQFYTQPRAVSSGGSATVEPIVYNLDTVSSALTIDGGENGFSVGDMTISTGGSVTIADGQKWLIADGNITSDVQGIPDQTGNSGNYLTTDGSTMSWAEVSSGGGGSYEATASGALSNGDMVVVNSDGTVSVVSETTVSQSAGSGVVFESGTVYDTAATYDSVNNKVVIAYRDYSNSHYGTAVVGTVSGTTISFGTPVVFTSSRVSYVSAAFDASSGSVVIAYRDWNNQHRGTAVVGTVSGTSISFGTPVVFRSGTTGETATVYDSSNQKIVITYIDESTYDYIYTVVCTVSGTSLSVGSAVQASTAADGLAATYDSANQKIIVIFQRGSTGKARVGTVSGTSISYGTEATFNAYPSTHHACAYDSVNQKVVITYYYSFGTTGHRAIVGTVSDTDISFGTEATFTESSNDNVTLAYDANAGKVVISYRDSSNSSYGTALPATVSGTSISFGSTTVFESAGTYEISSVYDSSNNCVVMAYRDSANSSYGTAAVFNNAYNMSNLTSSNFIGIADAAYSDGATATIQTVGAVDDAQTSLSAGSKYYVQADGTLSTTPDNPEVYAGVAVSATKLIVKG